MMLLSPNQTHFRGVWCCHCTQHRHCEVQSLGAWSTCLVVAARRRDLIRYLAKASLCGWSPVQWLRKVCFQATIGRPGCEMICRNYERRSTDLIACCARRFVGMFQQTQAYVGRNQIQWPYHDPWWHKLPNYLTTFEGSMLWIVGDRKDVMRPWFMAYARTMVLPLVESSVLRNFWIPQVIWCLDSSKYDGLSSVNQPSVDRESRREGVRASVHRFVWCERTCEHPLTSFVCTGMQCCCSSLDRQWR